MKHPEARKSLLEFAEKEHSEESLLFYDKAQSFRRAYSWASSDDPSLDSMRTEAVALIDEFLTENAMQQINLPSSNPFKNGLPPTTVPAANMFDSICRVVHKSIEQDIFHRFNSSSYAKELLMRIPAIAKRFSGSGMSNGNTNRSTNSDTSASATKASARGQNTHVDGNAC